MTDEELDALVRDAVLAADCMQETGTFETGQGILHDCARANTTLRAQLAVAREQTALGMADVMAAAAKEAREKALREAYEVVYKWWFGDGNALPQEIILALIEKPNAC